VVTYTAYLFNQEDNTPEDAIAHGVLTRTNSTVSDPDSYEAKDIETLLGYASCVDGEVDKVGLLWGWNGGDDFYTTGRTRLYRKRPDQIIIFIPITPEGRVA
jgi:hypothetical protein